MVKLDENEAAIPDSPDKKLEAMRANLRPL